MYDYHLKRPWWDEIIEETDRYVVFGVTTRSGKKIQWQIAKCPGLPSPDDPDAVDWPTEMARRAAAAAGPAGDAASA